jgi:hypothetical protein
MDRLFRVAIEEIVAEGIAAGEFAPIAVADFAIQLSALIDGLAIQVLLADPAVDSANMRRLSLDFARHALGLTTTV